ncbi:MAG: phage tail tip lysozyme [Candidatus Saccharibacteria bacterium]|nr:phage tail tip lysozyme [Candidatus Saccharibacteria bacterium]
MFYDPEECKNDCKIECVSSNGSDVTIIGDSILADSTTKNLLKGKFTSLSDDSYDSVVSRAWDAGVTQASSMRLKDVVVFEHGTNNGAITAEQLNNLLAVTGTQRTVVLITPYSATNTTLQAGYDTTAELFKETAKNNAQIKVVDWANKAKNAGYQLNDGENHVHPSTDEEKQALVDLISSAIGSSCNSGEAVVSGATAEEKVWSGLMSLGFTEIAAAGIMGNMAHEGLMSPVQWQVGHETDWGKDFSTIYNDNNSGSTGVGLVQFTYYKYYDILDKYYNENAPDLLVYFKEATTYSVASDGSHYCGGACFLEKVDDATANRLYSTELTIINKVVRGEYAQPYGFNGYQGIFDKTTPEDAADYWLDNYERPSDPEASRPIRRSDALKYYNQFKGQTSFSGTSSGSGGTSGTNCGGTKAVTAFKKYNFSDGQLRGILAIAEAENGGSLSSVKTEVSIMANLYEKNGTNDPGSTEEDKFIHYIRRKPGSEEHGWFATYNQYNESFNPPKTGELDAARDILNNGNRTIPQQILEHDMIADLTSVTNDGTEINKSDRSKYIKDKTVIKNKYGSTYIFYTWADPENNSGDPFGYFENNKPDASFSQETTAEASAVQTSVNISWQNGWITSGMDGYVKGTPEDAGLTVGDSSPTLDYSTNRPSDNSIGPNKITLHSTEGTNSVGQYGLDIYRSNPYPPHFTVDMKTKKVYQHFSIDKPASAVESVDTSAGVQIEIIGYSTEDKSSDEWYLHNTGNFGDSEWQYLAKLLVGISAYTGIKLESTLNWADGGNARIADSDTYTNYTGIIGHMHTISNDHTDPGNVWPILQKAINTMTAESTSGDDCGGEEASNAWTGEFPWWSQCGGMPWSDTPYGSCGTVCSSGCGCTSFAMMTTALTGVEHDPGEVCTYAGEKNMHICGKGSSWSLPTTIADHFGLKAEVVSDTSTEGVNRYLRDGWMIWMCGGGSDPFTSGGHCIGIRGITSDGKWLLADSKGNGEEVTLKKQWEPSAVYSAGLSTGSMRAIKKK